MSAGRATSRQIPQSLFDGAVGGGGTARPPFNASGSPLLTIPRDVERRLAVDESQERAQPDSMRARILLRVWRTRTRPTPRRSLSQPCVGPQQRTISHTVRSVARIGSNSKPVIRRRRGGAANARAGHRIAPASSGAERTRTRAGSGPASGLPRDHFPGAVPQRPHVEESTGGAGDAFSRICARPRMATDRAACERDRPACSVVHALVASSLLMSA